jgi:hypothetical protein
MHSIIKKVTEIESTPSHMNMEVAIPEQVKEGTYPFPA